MTVFDVLLSRQHCRIEIDTNTVERSIRPLALSRKNALFAGSDEGAGICVSADGPVAHRHGGDRTQGELGQPSRLVDGPKGTKVWVYFFGKTNDGPYLAASIWQDKLVVAQVTGRLPADKFGFNGIALGATGETVTQQLGKPMVVRPSSEPNTDLWSYQPWTFSVEMSDGRVTSIRVADPKFN